MKRKVVFCVLVLYSLKGLAQQTDFWHKGDMGVWLGYQLRKPIGKKFTWNNDIQIRFRNSNPSYDYTLLRSGILYEINKKFSITAGGLYGLNNYKEKSLPIWKNEFRLWQDLRYFIGDVANLNLMQQVRFEERWFNNETVNGESDNLFAFRFRYKAELRKAIFKTWRLIGGDELMYQYALGKTRFNQNRVWLGGGYAFHNKSEIQLQLMQIIWDAPDQTVLRINFIHQL